MVCMAPGTDRAHGTRSCATQRREPSRIGWPRCTGINGHGCGVVACGGASCMAGLNAEGALVAVPLFNSMFMLCASTTSTVYFQTYFDDSMTCAPAHPVRASPSP